ncbi:HHL109Cp [Eremothecium sinecaudum]|uniref:HHL109Cp n=1 Tax=Eremothecium sinecaudum TaxID=45286 RepID=A0A0X8HVU1_9SACH|nr:HHL109Cp [Eremothecium sinecaudum]AMD22661.1 HHL109Cp [Eremothecium sinecaudum]
MSEIAGATHGEQLLEASRRNNVELLDSILQEAKDLASLINESKDPFLNTSLHICCKYGSWDVLDKILDLECPIEIDPQNSEGDTPLHVISRYAVEEPEHGTFIASNLIQVGADPRIKNKSGQKPLDLLHSAELEGLCDILQGAELAIDTHNEAINADEVEEIDDE